MRVVEHRMESLHADDGIIREHLIVMIMQIERDTRRSDPPRQLSVDVKNP